MRLYDEEFEQGIPESYQGFISFFCSKQRFSYWATEEYQLECEALGPTG